MPIDGCGTRSCAGSVDSEYSRLSISNRDLGDFFIFMRTLRYFTRGRYFSADVGREMQCRRI